MSFPLLHMHEKLFGQVCGKGNAHLGLLICLWEACSGNVAVVTDHPDMMLETLNQAHCPYVI